MPNLKNIINSKDKLILSAQADLESVLLSLGTQFANDFAAIIGKGVFDVGIVLDALDALGWEENVLKTIRAESETVQKVLDYSRQMSNAEGINFALTSTQEAQLSAYLDATDGKVRAIKNYIAADMNQYAIEAKLSRKPTQQIINEITDRLAAEGRRASTEVGTALFQFDRSVMDDAYQNAGVELFYYFPGNVIETSRQACIAAVSDPRQQTGWTRTDIENEPLLDMIRGGYPYYNCRHRFISFEAAKGI